MCDKGQSGEALEAEVDMLHIRTAWARPGTPWGMGMGTGATNGNDGGMIMTWLWHYPRSSFAGAYSSQL